MKISCIYKIINTKSNMFYIGSTYDFYKRKNAHLSALRRNVHNNPKLQNTFNMYGEAIFEFHIVEICEESSLLEIESEYIKHLNPFYNISRDTTSPMKGLKHSEETKTKMSNSHKGIKYPNRKKPDCEHNKRRSEQRSNFKWSDKVKQKMSETAKRINSISRIDRTKLRKKVKDSLGNIFSSLKEASIYHNCHISTICDLLKGRSKQNKQKVSFYYYEDDSFDEK